MNDATARFLRHYGAAAVGPTPPQPALPVPDETLVARAGRASAEAFEG